MVSCVSNAQAAIAEACRCSHHKHQNHKYWAITSIWYHRKTFTLVAAKHKDILI